MKKNFFRLTTSVFCYLFFMLATVDLLAQQAVSDFYREPGINPNRSYINQSESEHIDPYTGALQRHYVDLHLPGNGGFDLKIIRSYNSASVNQSNSQTPDSLAGLTGLGWNIHFGRVIGNNTGKICEQPQDTTEGGLTFFPDDLQLELPDGSRQTLKWNQLTNGPITRWSSQRWIVVCNSTSGARTLSVFSPNGLRYIMEAKYTTNGSAGDAPLTFLGWHTTSILNRNNQWALINYNSNTELPEIANIQTNDGRYVAFDYFDQGRINRRLKSISSAGQTYQYNYSGRIGGSSDKYFLTNVTRPDGTEWNYAYNEYSLSGGAGGYLMKGLRTPQNGNIDYFYGRVTAETDRWGVAVSNMPVIAKKVSSDGGIWTYTYNPRNLNDYDTTIVDGPSGKTVYKYAGPNFVTSGSLWKMGLLISKSIGDKQVETYDWDRRTISGQRVQKGTGIYAKYDEDFYTPVLRQKVIVRDGASYTTTYSNYDAFESAQTITESGPNGGNRTTTLTYYANSLPEVQIIKQLQNESHAGSNITRTFDSKGNLETITRDGVATTYNYDVEGSIASVTLPRGIVNTYSNYYRGIARTENQAEGVSIYRGVSEAGNVEAETNGDGYTTSYGYDGLNRVSYIGYPRGNAVSIGYSATSKVAQRGALLEVTENDGFGRVIAITLGGIRRSFAYDALGRKTFESNPGSNAGTNYWYDILDRPTAIQNADGTRQYISYGASSKGVTDERGISTGYAYRAYGNPDQQFLIYINAPVADAHVSIGRNSKDQIYYVAQGGYARGYGYNDNYYLTTETNPETGTTIYGRDAAGNMTSKQVGASGATSYTYDGQNRLSTVVYTGDTPSVTNTYNKTNRLLSSNSLVANRIYAYDANNNLSSEALAIDGKSYAVGYDYNGNDQLSAMAYPDFGSDIYYAPDVLGRPTQVSGYVTNITYWPSGQINQITYANGTVTTYGQDSLRLWPSSFNTQKSGTNLNNNSYTYDGVGNLKTVTDSVDSSFNRSLDYDGINRLTISNGSWGAGTISYNGVGNITSQVFGGSSLSYTYDGNNRLSSVSGAKTATYSYDANGNIISGGGNSYTYDGAPNLRCINCSNPMARVQYQYDGTNHRVSETKAGEKIHEFVDSQGKQLLSTVGSGDYLNATEFFYLSGKRVAQRKLYSFRHAITSLTTDSSYVYQNQYTTLTATVSGPNPPGTVTFYKGNQILGTAIVINGKATLHVKFDTLGSTSITATYSDDIIKTKPAQSPALNFIVTVAPDISWLVPIINYLLSD